MEVAETEKATLSKRMQLTIFLINFSLARKCAEDDNDVIGMEEKTPHKVDIFCDEKKQLC